MQIHLDEDIFNVILNGIKTVEVRVNDEKRRKLKVGDTITFLKRPLELDTIKATVLDLVYYDNFEELVKDYDIKELYLEGYTKEYFLNLLKRFYTDEEVLKYGVVAIKFKRIDNE